MASGSVLILRCFGQARSLEGHYRNPNPRAMMPRRTSRVPPWMVSRGDQRRVVERLLETVVIAVGIAVATHRRHQSSTLLGSACSRVVPRSLDDRGCRRRRLQACSIPATESDMRRIVARCAQPRGRCPRPGSLQGSWPDDAYQLDEALPGFRGQRSGPLRSRASSALYLLQAMSTLAIMCRSGTNTSSNMTSLKSCAPVQVGDRADRRSPATSSR